MDVTVYTQNDCIFCNQIKEFLNKNEIKYTEKNVSSENYYNESLELGARGVPFTVINTKTYTGFNEQVKKALINLTK